MKRSKKHRVKQEMPETSTSRAANQKEHDLAYYIHDRVELMHQVFTVLKHKELKAMAPESVRHISINDLQELCMEELLGISSKRLCAILDGASPPSDTESSSESEQLETISLDSISSDEEILSQISSKKSKKHKHRSKSKKRKAKDKEDGDKDQADRSRRAGLTVLELLELQARARAIRAQLQQEQASAVSTGAPSESVTGNSSDDEVEIKEEAAEVVEISSEDEKPNIHELDDRLANIRNDPTIETSNSKTVTKKVNDLIITVPKINTSRKIKLKRNTNISSKTIDNDDRADKSLPKASSKVLVVEEVCSATVRKRGTELNALMSNKTSANVINTQSFSKLERAKVDAGNTKDKNKSKDKKKKRKRDKQDKDGSDHDEITLQLSDTEKMDLLEDLEGKKQEKFSGTEDSCSDSSDNDSVDASDKEDCRKANNSDTLKKNSDKNELEANKSKTDETISESVSTENNLNEKRSDEEIGNSRSLQEESLPDSVDGNDFEKDKVTTGTCDEVAKNNSNAETLEDASEKSQAADCKGNDNDVIEMTCSNSLHMDVATTVDVNESNQDVNVADQIVNNKPQTIDHQEVNNEKITEETIQETHVIDKEHTTSNEPVGISNSESIASDKVSDSEVSNANKKNVKDKSDGELSDRDSSEVEASDFKPDVVCISDDEDKKEKKKKKDKKSKKEKKSKKKKDFRESSDQNFYIETSKDVSKQTSEGEIIVMPEIIESYESSSKCDNMGVDEDVQSKGAVDSRTNDAKGVKCDTDNINPVTNTNAEDDVYEILELSDDSSCYEVEEISISKDPTAEELEVLSAKLDEIDSASGINNDKLESNETEEIANMSWKDRYLNSSKVKKVLTTANIINAMRKKNLELKKKLQESKKDIEIEVNAVKNIEIGNNDAEDGSIDQYNTLEGSTKYVDPVKEIEGSGAETGADGDKKDTVTKEMKKDAKQLLKMYKMLLKYNDMSKQKDPNKRRKKKKNSKEECRAGC